jgi:hypothetical protein
MKKLMFASCAALALVSCGGGDSGPAAGSASLAGTAPTIQALAGKPAAVPDPTLVAQPIVRVNTSTDGQQTLRAIGALTDGGYSVGWLSVFSTPPDENGSFTTFDRPFVQRYGSSGAPVGSNGIIDANDRAMGILTDGRVVTVCCENQRGPQVNMFITWLAPDGSFLDLRNVITRSQVTNISTDPFFASMKVTALADGGFIVSWLDVQPIEVGLFQTLYTQRYDALNREVGGPVSVAGATSGAVMPYGISADAQGGYTVDVTNAFSNNFIHFDANQTRLDIFVPTLARPVFLLPLEGDRYVLFTPASSGATLQFLDAAGNPVGAAMPIPGVPSQARELADGSFVVFWNLAGNLTAQRFDSTGTPMGNQLAIASHVGPFDVAALADGGFAAAWSGPGAGLDLDVFATRFVEVLTSAQMKRKACQDSAKGMTGQARKAFIDACAAA